MGMSRGSGLSNGSGLYGGFSGLSAGYGLTESGILPQTYAWQVAVAANGGSVSPGRLAIVNQFIAAEVGAGNWALTDDYWGLWAENAIQALTSLKQRRLATAVNSPTFTVNAGYAFDGTTNYINTDFVPSTHAVAMTGTSLGLSVYERTNVGSTTYHGTRQTASRNLYLSPRTFSSVYLGGANGDTGNLGSVGNSRGLTSVEQSAGTVGYDKNGVSVGTVTPTVGSTLPSFSIYLGAYNASGTPTGFRAASVGLAVARAALSAPQKLAQYNNIQAFATAVGAQV